MADIFDVYPQKNSPDNEAIHNPSPLLSHPRAAEGEETPEDPSASHEESRQSRHPDILKEPSEEIIGLRTALNEEGYRNIRIAHNEFDFGDNETTLLRAPGTDHWIFETTTFASGADSGWVLSDGSPIKSDQRIEDEMILKKDNTEYKVRFTQKGEVVLGKKTV